MISVLLLDQKTVTHLDLCDLPLLGRYRWSPRQHGNNVYVRAKIDGEWVYLHRLILSPDRDLIVDHIDGNPLNNTRCNLRAVSQRQNVWNVRSQQSRGVSLRNGKWRARIWRMGKRLELGSYITETEAIRAYDVAVSVFRDAEAFRNGEEINALAISFPPAARRALLSFAK